MNEKIRTRVAALRDVMKREGVEAFIVPSTDPHLSEYVADHWASRKWISGFTGSMGTIVVTLNEAGLWTDSRYFLQASIQLEGTGIDLYKLMIPGTPSIPEFLSSKLNSGAAVGIDGKVFASKDAAALEADLKKSGIHVRSIADPMEEIWSDRPAIPETPAFIHELKYAGKSCVEKINQVREEIKKAGAESILVSALDEIAWTLNLRGSDVHCNPVVVSYLYISMNEAHYFINPKKVTPEVASYLQESGITTHDYTEIFTFLAATSSKNILIESAKTNYAAIQSIPSTCEIIDQLAPTALLKAVRNETEIEGIHAVMVRDGVAMVKFLMWLEKAIPQGGQTEMSIDKVLCDFRAQQENFMGISFNTITGYREHGAIVHYMATPETDAPLYPEGYLLIDSGGQYLDGTTDITRTIALGELTEEAKTDFTLILKCNIGLATAIFPAGIRGVQLDVLARIPIWKHRMNYLHGTGHGVGHFLNVHEGPQSIRMEENPVKLQLHMTTTNEPALYKEGRHGIRTENQMLIVPAGEGQFGDYWQFETLTLCPICKKGIIKEMLSADEIEWFNNYHKNVYEKLSPCLNEEEKAWLKEACAAI